MIDWRLAEALAGRLSGQPSLPGPDGDQVATLAEECLGLVVGYSGLEPEEDPPIAEAVTRHEWVEANIASLRPLLDPVVTRLGARAGRGREGVKLAAAATLTVEAGAVLGLLSRRVMGQYDLALVAGPDDPPPRLLFVAPNVAEAASAFDSRGDDFLRWVALHEVTHAVQFGSVPWLRDHLGGIATELLGALDPGGGSARRPFGEMAGELVERAVRTVRQRDPVALALSRREHELVDRMQAAMALVEGHAEHVMDAAGADIPSLRRMRRAMSQRRQAPGPLWRVLSRLLGMEMKMRQYEKGGRFCDAVVAQAGVAGLNRAWESPESLPSLAEISDPGRWLARVGA